MCLIAASSLLTLIDHIKFGKVYSLEYTDISKVFLVPHDVGLSWTVILADCCVLDIFCTNIHPRSCRLSAPVGRMTPWSESSEGTVVLVAEASSISGMWVSF
jgi:hypothetical protein